jgi:hypothetical protein
MQLKFLFKSAVLSLASFSVLAGGMYNPEPQECASDSLCDELDYPIIWGKIITLNAGPVWANPGKSQTVQITGSQYNYYSAHRENETLGSGEIVFSLQRSIHPLVMGRIGVGIAGAGNADLQGQVWIDQNPTQDFYRYHYRVNHSRITLKGMLLGGNNQSFVNPYISASGGIGFNHSYSYRAVPVSPLYPEVLNFVNNTHSTAFSWTVGAGLSKQFLQHWRAGVGYEVANWGKNKLDPFVGQADTIGLYLNDIYTHQLLFSLSYVC